MRLPLGNSRGQRENALFLPILFAVLALLLITPLRVPLRAFSLSIATPVWSLGKTIKHGTQVLLPSVFSRASLVEENVRLRHEIESLRAEEWRTEALRRERDLLASVLHRASSTDALLLAYVLASPNFSPYDTLVVDTGADTGIFPGAKVIVDGGFVVGTITEVLPSSAIAQLYSSPGVTKHVIVGSSRIPAVAHGVGGGNYRIELPKNTDIAEGDEVRVQGSVEEFLGVVERMIVDEKTGITTLYLRLPINMTELDSVIIDLTPVSYE